MKLKLLCVLFILWGVHGDKWVPVRTFQGTFKACQALAKVATDDAITVVCFPTNFDPRG